MLPTITLDTESLCHRSRLSSQYGPQQYVGQAFAFRLDEIDRQLAGSATCIDELLSRHILAGMTRHPIKSSVLFWYAVTTQLLFIVACERSLKAQFPWLRDLPGFYESGQDYVPPPAVPFLLWDKHNLYRVYEHPSAVEDGVTYVCDMGDLSGIKIIPQRANEWACLTQDDAELRFYSIVPAQSDQLIQAEAGRFLLRHAWYIAA